MTTNGAHVDQPADAAFEVLVIGAGQSGLAMDGNCGSMAGRS